jgi:hypothetical protein
MTQLFDDEIPHIPKKTIEDLIYLWFVDWYEVWLCVEDWEFRIYNYEYWDYNSIVDNWHQDETWRDYADNYFDCACDCLDVDTIRYSIPMFSSNEPKEMAKQLLETCKADLEDTATHLEATSGWPWQALIDFIAKWLEKIAEYENRLVYCYYK